MKVAKIFEAFDIQCPQCGQNKLEVISDISQEDTISHGIIFQNIKVAPIFKCGYCNSEFIGELKLSPIKRYIKINFQAKF